MNTHLHSYTVTAADTAINTTIKVPFNFGAHFFWYTLTVWVTWDVLGRLNWGFQWLIYRCFQGMARNRRAISHQRTEPWHPAQKIYPICWLSQQTPQCIFISKINRETPLLQGEIQSRQRSRNGHMAIEKGSLDYICFDFFYLLLFINWESFYKT